MGNRIEISKLDFALILGAVAPKKFPEAAKLFAEECAKVLDDELKRRGVRHG